jgi:hypothetical protein
MTHSAPASDSLATVTATASTNPPGYKMEPTDPGMYYHGPVPSGEGEQQAHPGLGLFNPHQVPAALLYLVH